MIQKSILPRDIDSKLFLFRAFVLILGAAWLFGGAFLVSSAQTRNKNVNAKQTPTPKKTIPKATPKPTAKTTPKPTVKTTPKPSPKTTPKATPKPSPQAPQYILTAFNVNLREEPSTGADSDGQLKFGTIVRSLERTAKQETIGGKTGFWHKIAPVSGKSGWVFGGFLKTFDSNQRETIYKQITADKFKSAKRSFDENTELYDFLTRAQGEVKTRSIAAEIGYWRLLALKAALEAIPFEDKDKSPYKDFTDRTDINITYSEPSGEWYVRSERFWSLSKKYADLPIAEKIAWTAAENPLPGECEGYLNCYLFGLRITHGEYLERFPKGAHAAESLKAIRDQLSPIVADAEKKEIYTTPSDVSDRAEFYKMIAELRTIVSRTGFFEKEYILRQLDKIAEGYR